MRIGDSNRLKTVPDVSRRRSASSGGGEAGPAPRNLSDVTSIMGIPANELTPKVHDAIVKLMAEVERLRQRVEEQTARIAYLEQLADQDTLAPVANRRAFVRELSRVMSYSARYGAPSSVIYFDLNDLKAINDTYGHAAGDAALLRVAAVLTEHVRESDLVGRLGGDEFGVVLAHADEATATEKAVQLVDRIEREPLKWQDQRIQLKLAYGTNTFRGGGNAGDALEAADRAMYARKNGDKVKTAL